MRALAAPCLCLSLAASAADCPWVPPKAPPKFTVSEGSAVLEWRLDPAFARCAREAGGSLSASISAGDGKGPLVEVARKDGLSATIHLGAWAGILCKLAPLPDRAQATLVGTGAMAPASWQSPVTRGLHCDRCTYRSYEGSMAIWVNQRPGKPGMVTIRGSYDDQFRVCAKVDSKLELRVYLGRTEAEARTRPDATFALAGMERSARFEEHLPHAELCRDRPAFLGVELVGDGEFAQLNGAGRSVVEARCPR